MKTVLLASDSFKGTLSSKEIIEIAEAVIRERFSSEWSLDALEIADGGEGTLDALSKVLGGERVEVPTLGAEGNAVQAPLLLRGDEAYLEVASIVGLPMIKGSIDPLRRSTRGLAALIKEAIHRGAKKITIGLGGSSTSEMGIGMLQELGLDFHTEEKVTMANVDTIQKLSWGQLPKNIAGVRFTCLSDVNSPLLGENGAVKAYGPQKGYGPYIEGMEDKMGHLASLSESLLRKDFSSFPGAGAAGGLGFAFKAFLGADLISVSVASSRRQKRPISSSRARAASIVNRSRVRRFRAFQSEQTLGSSSSSAARAKCPPSLFPSMRLPGPGRVLRKSNLTRRKNTHPRWLGSLNPVRRFVLERRNF